VIFLIVQVDVEDDDDGASMQDNSIVGSANSNRRGSNAESTLSQETQAFRAQSNSQQSEYDSLLRELMEVSEISEKQRDRRNSTSMRPAGYDGSVFLDYNIY